MSSHPGTLFNWIFCHVKQFILFCHIYLHIISLTFTWLIETGKVSDRKNKGRKWGFSNLGTSKCRLKCWVNWISSSSLSICYNTIHLFLLQCSFLVVPIEVGRVYFYTPLVLFLDLLIRMLANRGLAVFLWFNSVSCSPAIYRERSILCDCPFSD